MLGLRTVIYHVPDLGQAKAWYSAAFGVLPYFDEPYYVGFNIGGFELGLDPDMSGIAVGTNVVAYWGVADAAQAYQDLIHKGARAHSPVQEVGGGIRVAAVSDPFGNVIGIIENPHFQIQESQPPSAPDFTA
jgi:predicted enzyme related to lactoylglutathione lyase